MTFELCSNCQSSKKLLVLAVRIFHQAMYAHDTLAVRNSLACNINSLEYSLVNMIAIMLFVRRKF